MKPYIISDQIHLFKEHNYLKVGNRVYKLGDVKEYLQTYHETLCNHYKLNSRTHYDKDGRLHIYYAWDSIFVEAYKKRLFLRYQGKGLVAVGFRFAITGGGKRLC